MADTDGAGRGGGLVDGDPSWWVVFVVAIGVTVVYGAVFLSLVAAVLLGVAWVRGRWRS